MTPTPDIEPIREGLARMIAGSIDEERFWNSPGMLRAADACLTYLIKRQAFLYDVYERIIAEKGLGK